MNGLWYRSQRTTAASFPIVNCTGYAHDDSTTGYVSTFCGLRLPFVGNCLFSMWFVIKAATIELENLESVHCPITYKIRYVENTSKDKLM